METKNSSSMSDKVQVDLNCRCRRFQATELDIPIDTMLGTCKLLSSYQQLEVDD